MCEEKEGVMRNVMTTRAPGGAKNMTLNGHFSRPAETDPYADIQNA